MSNPTPQRRRPIVHVAAWKQAWRSLTRRPAFLATSVVTLAFGVGVTTAVFSLVDTVLVKPLPYPDADRLVTVYESSSSAREKTSLIAPARLEDWQRLSRTFVALAGSYSENVTDTSGADPERLEGRRVSRRFFQAYGVQPELGRTFVEAEEQANGPGAVVISDRFWARRFQRDRAAIGHALTIGGRSYAIVGVMPAAFSGAATDVWMPAQMNPWLLQQARDARFLGGIGRIRPGVALDAAAADLASVQASLAREFPKSDAGWSVEIRALKDVRIGNARRGLVLVFAAVTSLWIIALVNIAGLTLVQVHRRGRELAIRAALGASRASVMGTVAREGLIIATMGGGLGAGLAALLVRVMPAVLTATPRINELVLDVRAVGFAALASLFAACMFSAVPALSGTRASLSEFAGGSRGATEGRHRLQKVFVVAQVALSLVLVGSATLLLRSYQNLTHVETGIDPANAITFHVGARWDEDRVRIGQLQQQLLARLEELPHVQAAGLVNFLPASAATLRYQVHLEGVRGPNEDGTITAGSRTMGGAYPQAMGMRLVAGSWCGDLTADMTRPQSALLNQRFVDVHAPNQNVIGRTLRQTAFPGNPITIAGVVANVAEDGHAAGPTPYVYVCANGGSWPDPEYVVRTADARAFAADLRRIVREIDPARAIFGLRPIQDVLDAALEQPRFDAATLGLFAGAALALAGVGLYSLFMLVVSGRAREIAVRLAIGAEPSEMIRMVMAGAGRLLAGGIAIGLVVTAAADRVLRGVLFGVSPLDVPALAIAALTLAIVCAVAVAGPALKASRIEPIETLKTE